ncbi:MAG: hypothetical protein H0U74_12885 [Bradymonadaceae bacterium]|nr:hypothetical protein [Lujinxingiaceae bacterium]
MKKVMVALLAVSCLLWACESSPRRVNDTSERSSVAAVGTTTEAEALDLDALVLRVEALRDREFRAAPRFVAVTEMAAGPFRPKLAESVVADQRAILQGLFGLEQAMLKAGTSGLESLARLVTNEDMASVHYLAGHPDREKLRLALIVALVEALDAEHFEAPMAASSWDEQLALDATRVGDALFVATHEALGARGHKVSSEELASRPELALALDVLRGELEPAPVADARFVEGLSQAGVAFVMREGLALSAAMFRASGWSGVELLKLSGPRTSGHVVRPDRWLSGEDVGSWSWPGELERTRAATGWKESARGHVGPGIMAMWLGRYIEARTARTVYSGWMSDAYRLHHKEGSKGWVFEWISHWDTPHSAQQIAAAFEMVLSRQRPIDAQGGVHHAVVHKGLSVSVIVHDRAFEATTLINSATLLSGARVVYMAGEPRPLGFTPTRRERFLQQAEQASLVSERFADPASGLAMGLGAIGAWSVQKTDEVSIRWFARHDDGAILQLTTELRDLLGPAFGTQAYRTQMEAAFFDSLGGGGQVMPVLASKQAVGDVLELRGEGAIEGQPRRLLVRQFLHHDVVVTFSLQAPPRSFEGHLEQAKAVFETIELVPDDLAAGRGAAEGEKEVIRFEVED